MKFLRSHPYLALFFACVAVRAATAVVFRQPGYMDAYYYYDIAENLYHGKGFTENFVWNYLTVPNAVEHPSNTYWMPLTSVAIYPFFALLGPSFFASQLPFVLLSAVMAPLAFYLGVDVFGSRRYGWIMGLFTIFSGISFPYWVMPDNLTLFAVTSLLAIIFMYKGLRDDEWYFVPAGAAIGLSYLSRADGLLLLVVLVSAFVLGRQRGSAKRSGRPASWWPPALTFSAAGVVVSPWLYHVWNATGTPLPSGSLKIVFLREYNDIFAYARNLGWRYYLNLIDPSPSWGLWSILSSKGEALLNNLLIVGRPTFFFLAPFFLVGFFVRASNHDLWSPEPARQIFSLRDPTVLWRRVEYLPFLFYMILLYLSMSLLFTFPGTRGSVVHSSGGLLPFVLGAILVGIDGSIAAVSHRHRPKAMPSRQRTWLGAFLLGALVLSVGWTTQMVGTWDQHYDTYRSIAAWVKKDGGPNAVVMIVDPPGYFYVSHTPAVVLTSDDLSTNLAIAKRYGASYLVLEPARPASLTDLYRNKGGHPKLELAAEIEKTQIYRISKDL